MNLNNNLPDRAIFLDRDGTIMEDMGHVGTTEDVLIFPFTVDALKMLQEKFLLFIVTNQSGVSLGRTTREAVDRVNSHVLTYLKSEGVNIQRLYCCSHARKDNCECIKPKPYFIKQAQMDFNIDISKSYSIGDHVHDVEFAASAGGTGVFVFTGHGRKHHQELPPGANCFENLREAANWILSRSEVSAETASTATQV